VSWALGDGVQPGSQSQQPLMSLPQRHLAPPSVPEWDAERGEAADSPNVASSSAAFWREPVDNQLLCRLQAVWPWASVCTSLILCPSPYHGCASPILMRGAVVRISVQVSSPKKLRL
jgi:hypothetical protein